MIAVVRHFDLESRQMRAGRWQSTVGTILAGRTLGLLGLGRIGKRMAAYARVFEMPVIAWSQNLTDETAVLSRPIPSLFALRPVATRRSVPSIARSPRESLTYTLTRSPECPSTRRVVAFS